MIDSFNQTLTDNITLSQNTTGGGDENETDFSLIEIILADVPFLALGFLGLTIITFYSTFNRSNRRMLLLEISSLSACFASLLNLIGMFYNQDQVAFFNFQNIQEESLRKFILVMLSVKQVLLAISTGIRLLYFHFSLEQIRKQQIDFTLLTNGISVEGGGGEKRPKSFTQMIQERNRTYCDAVDGRDAQCVWSKMARLSIIFTVFVVFTLELTWRIGFLFDLSQATIFRRMNIASFAIQSVLYLIFSSCPIHHIIQTSRTFRKNVLRQYGGLIAGVILGVVVIIGSLASFGLSERVVGRLFQGVQLYVLIISQMILDFTLLLQSTAPPVTSDSGVKYQYHHQDSYEVLSIPDASIFRVSPPSISTPSPHPFLPNNGKRVSFVPNIHSHRPFSQGHPRDPPRFRTSVSSRIKTWVLSGHSAYSHPEEGRYLNIPPTQRSSGRSSHSGNEGTYETHQNTFERNSTPIPPSPISKDRDSDRLEPRSMEPARRSSQTIFNTLTRFSQGQGDNIMDLIGIRRTTPSPGARRLILGSEMGDAEAEGLPSSGNNSRESGTSASGLADLPLNFPRPPSRSTTVPTLDKLDFGDMAVDELPLPNRLFVREQQLQMKNKGHGRMRSDMTHINVTSFIEGGSSRVDSMGSTANLIHQQYQSITSLIQPSSWMSKHHSNLSATLTLSSEAPTEVYLPVPPSQAHIHVQSPTSSGSSDTTPTYSIHDVRDAQISRVLTRSTSQPLLPTYTNTHASSNTPLRYENPSTLSRVGQIQRQSKSQNRLSDPIPESPTLPSSANSQSNSKGQVKMGRAATTGQEWYKRKYGVI
ncbi:hypothetical protein I302_101671 [Kwoniella bestiolae CBS 10118]|uniref:Uncharacterized protein n=1 Tax=Kwoniella bestiolae CBS 10118 TaxID=1296100 RepID=A0A1B9GCV9_9TREE|nr:hypothetical protein I302_00348 [Kwoniella bestiolae CBS 10118]OCF28858.1 hypothetical protein I302_00348 [Kwoniella bestiolae CBS 10118]